MVSKIDYEVESVHESANHATVLFSKFRYRGILG